MLTPAIILNSSPATCCDVPLPADPILSLPGLASGIGDELGNRFRGKRRIHHHHVGRAHDAGDRRDVAEEIEAEPIVERRVDGVRRADHQQRVAVGRRVHDRFGGDVAAGAGAVLDDELLAEPVRQPLRHQPRHDVERAAGGEPDDYPHRPRWIRLRQTGARTAVSAARAGGKTQETAAWHRHLSARFFLCRRRLIPASGCRP